MLAEKKKQEQFVPYTRELFYLFLKTASNLRSLSPVRGSYSKQMAEMVKYDQFVPRAGELFYCWQLGWRDLVVGPRYGGVFLVKVLVEQGRE